MLDELGEEIAEDSPFVIMRADLADELAAAAEETEAGTSTDERGRVARPLPNSAPDIDEGLAGFLAALTGVKVDKG